MKYGITYSTKYAEELGFDPNFLLLNILQDFSFDVIRIPVYWDLIETSPDDFDFKKLDMIIELLDKYNQPYILSIGRKTPRWPEFHEPTYIREFISKNIGNDLEISNYLLSRLENVFSIVLQRYSNNKNLRGWQVENEPFFSFGMTEFPIQTDMYHKEVELFRQIYNSKCPDAEPIIYCSTSQQIEHINVFNRSNIDRIGINIYPRIYQSATSLYVDNKYWWWKIFLFFKKLMFSGKFFVSEIQCEPWTNDKHISEMSRNEIDQAFTIDNIVKNLNIVKSLSVDEVWLWGIEWWYFKAKYRNNSTYLSFFKQYLQAK